MRHNIIDVSVAARTTHSPKKKTAIYYAYHIKKIVFPVLFTIYLICRRFYYNFSSAFSSCFSPCYMPSAHVFPFVSNYCRTWAIFGWAIRIYWRQFEQSLFPFKTSEEKKNVHIFPVHNAYMHSIASIVEIIIICADWQ